MYCFEQKPANLVNQRINKIVIITLNIQVKTLRFHSSPEPYKIWYFEPQQEKPREWTLIDYISIIHKAAGQPPIFPCTAKFLLRRLNSFRAKSFPTSPGLPLEFIQSEKYRVNFKVLLGWVSVDLKGSRKSFDRTRPFWSFSHRHMNNCRILCNMMSHSKQSKHMNDDDLYKVSNARQESGEWKPKRPIWSFLLFPPTVSFLN